MKKEAWNCYVHVSDRGRRNNPKRQTMEKAFHAHTGVKHYAYPSSFLRNFLRFYLYDEHNASKSICRDEQKCPSESNHQGILCTDSSNSWQK